ncbi:MAG: antirestriction protein ArdA [Pseudonocardiaceae bacterium]
MEHEPHSPEGGEHHHQANAEHDTPPAPIYEQLSDEQRIQRGIADARSEGRPIDDATARRIASQLHGGQDSALYALASSGAILDRLEREIAEAVQDLPPARDSWIDALLAYAEWRGEDRGPREGWATLSADDAQQAIEAVRSAASRERRADRAWLERYVELGLDPGDAEALIEFEHLSRHQRAEWAGIAEPSHSAGLTDEAETTASIGQPATAGQEPDAETERTTSPEQNRRLHPRIYVRCLAAYVSGLLHGCWVDADQDEDALRTEVEMMLQSSPVPEAEEYAIHDHEGFTGYPLGEYENLAFVSRLAQGIAEHGAAFAAYADWIGREDAELAHFTDHFAGTYPTREAWAEEVAEEIFEWPRWREAIPEILRSHVRLDLTDLALTLEQYRHVVEGSEGVYVFNPDA